LESVIVHTVVILHMYITYLKCIILKNYIFFYNFQQNVERIKVENDVDCVSEGDLMKTDDVYTPLSSSIQNAEPEVSPVSSCSCCSYLCGCVHLCSSSMSFVVLHPFLRALTVISFV
jgi:hypothetical protein